MASAKPVETLLSKCEIPIIDLSHIGTDTCPMRSVVRRVGRELHAALSEKGLALLVNHGIADEKLKAVYGDLDNMCALPKDSKQLYRSSPSCESGYSTPELEVSAENDKRELQYSFNITSLSQPHMPTEEQVPHFLAHAAPLARDFTNLSRLLLNSLALALDLPLTYLVERHAQMLTEEGTNTSCMSLLYHPPVPPSDHARDENAITRCLPHRDTDTLTLVAQDCEGGFEVKLPSTSKWQAVGHLPGSLLVYSGELLAGWTSNKYPALVSRVIIPEQPYVRSRGRHSLSFYCRPDAGAQVCCPLVVPAPIAAPVIYPSSRSLHNRFINVCHQVQKRFKETYA